ncbi:MAG: phosphoglycerate dehydrogenase [bacterium]|nr:phosphoglycerate dehydrogenase [bacterium]
MPKILVLDNLSEEGIQVFREAEGFEVDVMPPQKPEELMAVLPAYDGVVIRSATTVTAEAIEKASNLKVIGRAGVGTDNIDKAAATKRGIVVMNTPGGNTVSTCEHAFALLFALLRRVPAAHQTMMDGRWDRKKFKGTEVRGKTFGIIGVGRIGGEVAKRAQAFEMKVLAYDPILTKLKAEALGVELVELDELLERSDFISVHAPKSDKTVNMINAETFKKMKPTVRIINAARGGIVNEQDLAEALKEGTIGGAALDVYTSEPFEDNPFVGLDNVVMTPHLAASTDEAQLSVAIDIAKQMVDYLDTGTIVNAVNVPSLDAETREKLQPLLYLAERLGRFQGLFCEGSPSSVEVEYAGDIGVTDTYPITAAALQGFLEPSVETVNCVSAPSLLEEHGIQYSETRSPKPTDYTFSITLKVKTDKEEHQVAGTLFGPNKDPRICIIDDTRVDVRPEGWILVCLNDDKPLIIGRVATLMGEAGINIADMTLGRDAKGGRAATVLNLDQSVNEETLEKVRQVPYVNQARVVAMQNG